MEEPVPRVKPVFGLKNRQAVEKPGGDDQGVKKPGDEDKGAKEPGDEYQGVKKPGDEAQGVKKPGDEVKEVNNPVNEDKGVKKRAARKPTGKKPAVKKPPVKKPPVKKITAKPPTKSFSMADKTLTNITSIVGIPMTSITVGGWKETPIVQTTSLNSEQASNKDSTVVNLTSSPHRSDSITSITSASSIDQEESSQKSGSPPITPPPGSPAQLSAPYQSTERRQLLLARQAITQLQLDR